MSELADEADSKSVDGDIVWVRPPLPAPEKAGAERHKGCTALFGRNSAFKRQGGKMRKIGSILCLLVAAAAVLFAFVSFGSRNSMFFGLAMFRVIKDGSFMGFIGNIACVLITVLGYGAAGYYGLTKKDDKMALMCSGGVTLLGIISLVIACFNGFTVGDIVIIIPSAMVLCSLFLSKD